MKKYESELFKMVVEMLFFENNDKKNTNQM